jgi:release factor glutamine methyltransferase
MPDLEPANCPPLIRELVSRYAGRIVSLPDKPEETIVAVVRALWLRSANIPASATRALHLPLPTLTDEQHQTLMSLLEQRANGTPLAHLTGRQQFMGLEFMCSSHALIPRQETEILGNAACALLRERILVENPEPKVMDVCTGSGNLAVSIAAHVPSANLFAADLSPEAVAIALANARQLGCGDRVRGFIGDLFGPFEAEQYYHCFDLIVCNPPYITTAKLQTLNPEIGAHEPKMAFDAGPLGLAILWRLLQDAPRFLKPGAWLAFETGLGQGQGVLRRVSRDPQFVNTQGVTDSQGNVRVITSQFRRHDNAG